MFKCFSYGGLQMQHRPTLRVDDEDSQIGIIWRVPHYPHMNPRQAGIASYRFCMVPIEVARLDARDRSRPRKSIRVRPKPTVITSRDFARLLKCALRIRADTECP